MSINLTIDSTASSLALNDRPNGFRVTAFDPGNQPPDTQWASSVDTEGARRAGSHPQNRTVTATVLIDKSTAAALQTAEQTLTRKIAKLNREGGELLLTLPSTSTITFDVEDAYLSRPFTPQTARGNIAEYNLTFVCKPYGRGAEQDLGDNPETTLPALIFTEASIPGDVPALGRLVADNDNASVNMWQLIWGLESRYYSSSANAALYYEAEGRTALSETASAVGSGASATNVMRNSALTSTYKALMSTQATGGGAHFSHVGTFRVYARMMVAGGGSSTVTVALEWSEADFMRYTRNPEVQLTGTGSSSVQGWELVDLGLVALTPVTSGTQRWEGRIIGKSTLTNDILDIDYLMIVPVAEGSGIASAVARDFTSTGYVSEDHFTSTTAGNALNARVAPTGGTWATSGDATDLAFTDSFITNGSEGLARGVASSTSGRLAVLGTTNYSSVTVQTSVGRDGTPSATGHELRLGVIARWTDASNYLRAYLKIPYVGDAPVGLVIEQRVSGVTSTIASMSGISVNVAMNQLQPLRLTVYTTGEAVLKLFNNAGTVVEAECSGFSAALMAGGTLATGEPGIWDYSATSTHNRYYDDFLVWVPGIDAAAFGNQSIEVRHDRVQREDSGGTMWTKVSSYEGDYLLVPASGAEARTVRMIVKFLRGDGIDNGIDDLSARLFVTPRYLTVPT